MYCFQICMHAIVKSRLETLLHYKSIRSRNDLLFLVIGVNKPIDRMLLSWTATWALPCWENDSCAVRKDGISGGFQIRFLPKVQVKTLREHGWTHCKSSLLNQQDHLSSDKQSLFTLSFGTHEGYIYIEHTSFKITLPVECLFIYSINLYL